MVSRHVVPPHDLAPHPLPPIMDVLSYLESKGLSPRKASTDQYLIRCNFCGDSKNQSHRHLYLNREHGAFKCHRCGEEGSFAAFQRALGDEPARVSKVSLTAIETLDHAARIAQDGLVDHPDVMDYLITQRGLTIETIEDARLGYFDRNWWEELRGVASMEQLRDAGIVGPESNDPWVMHALSIPYVEDGAVRQLRGKVLGGRTLGLHHREVRLYLADKVRGQAESYICEGEMDALLLNQLGFPACGVPGADVWKSDWSRYFTDARRIFIIPDHDDINPNTGRRPGITGAKKTQAKLGKAALIVPLQEDDSDPPVDVTDYFIRDGHTKDDFVSVIDAFRSSKLFSIDSALREFYAVLDSEGISMGFKDLDAILHPGMLPGQVCVVIAKTGVGKTAFATQVIHNIAESGVPSLVLSLEQTRGEIAHRLERIARFKEPLIQREKLVAHYEHMLINDDNRVAPEDVEFLFREFEDLVGVPPKIVFIDYLGYWAKSFRGGSAYEQTTAAVMELKRIAKEFRVVVVSPHQVSRTGKRGEKLTLDMARDSGAVEETSDFLLALRAPGEQLGYGSPYSDRADVRLEILKSRHGGVGKEIRLLWAPHSLSLVPNIMENVLRVEKEWRMDDQGLNYEQALKVMRGEAYL